MSLIPAFRRDLELLADIRTVDQSRDFLHLWWLGQSGFLIRWNGHTLLLDPYLSDALTEKYRDTDKPHVRLSERVVDPALLTDIDIVTSSHNHTDHLDAATLLPLMEANPGIQMVLPAANVDFARARLGHGGALVSMHGLDDGTTLEAGGFSITGLAAAHNDIARDAQGRCHYLSLIIRAGDFTLYHSGDTLWHGGLVPALLLARPDIMMLPINGNLPARRVAGNLNGTEAAALAKACAAGLVIPHHFDLFEFNTADPSEFTGACSRLGQTARVLRLGEGLRWPLV